MAEERERILTAPRSVTQHDGDVTKIGPRSWTVVMGSALGAFFGRTGPSEVVNYSFKSQRSFHHATYVDHVAVVEPGLNRIWNKVQCHEDIFRLTKEGQKRLEFDVKTGKSTNAVLRSFSRQGCVAVCRACIRGFARQRAHASMKNVCGSLFRLGRASQISSM